MDFRDQWNLHFTIKNRIGVVMRSRELLQENRRFFVCLLIAIIRSWGGGLVAHQVGGGQRSCSDLCPRFLLGAGMHGWWHTSSLSYSSCRHELRFFLERCQEKSGVYPT